MHIACGDFLFRGKIIARLFRCSCLAAKNHTVSACSLAAASTMALCRCHLFTDRRIFLCILPNRRRLLCLRWFLRIRTKNVVGWKWAS
jgi:hypothetical protein